MLVIKWLLEIGFYLNISLHLCKALQKHDSYSKEHVTLPLYLWVCGCGGVKQQIIDSCLGHLVFWRCRLPQIAYPPSQRHARAESKVNYHTRTERRRGDWERGEH